MLNASFNFEFILKTQFRGKELFIIMLQDRAVYGSPFSKEVPQCLEVTYHRRGSPISGNVAIRLCN